MLNLVTLHKINSHWATYLGCDLNDLRAAHTLVMPHAGLGNYPGLMFFRTEQACIISAPANLVSMIKPLVASRTPEEAYSPEFLRTHFNPLTEQVIGPSWVGYVDERNYKFATTGTAKLLAQNGTFLGDYSTMLQEFARSCPPEEWAHGGVSINDLAIFGYLYQGKLVAVGSLKKISSTIVNLGLITQPAYRGKHYGKAISSAMTLYGLDMGAIVQYRTLQLNRPSLALARTLGFEYYASTIVMRLKIGVQ